MTNLTTGYVYDTKFYLQKYNTCGRTSDRTNLKTEESSEEELAGRCQGGNEEFLPDPRINGE